MEIKITYSKYELEKAIDYCWNNNPSWQRGDHTKDDIRKDFIKSMHRLATNRNITWVSASRGCILIPDCTEENMDNDENTCHISIYVPPAFGSNIVDWEADIGMETGSISATEYWKDI